MDISNAVPDLTEVARHSQGRCLGYYHISYAGGDAIQCNNVHLSVSLWFLGSYHIFILEPHELAARYFQHMYSCSVLSSDDELLVQLTTTMSSTIVFDTVSNLIE
jgi:hypothetical protein